MHLNAANFSALLEASKAMLALVDKHGIGDDDHESEPVVAALRHTIRQAEGQPPKPPMPAHLRSLRWRGRGPERRAADPHRILDLTMAADRE